MSITTKIAEWKQNEDKRHDARSAAVAIVQMDPNAREDLITYLKAFNEAQAAGDEAKAAFRAQADRMVGEARAHCEKMVSGAQDEAKRILRTLNGD